MENIRGSAWIDMKFRSEQFKTTLVCLLLAAATLLVYYPAHHFSFISLDDPTYVRDNVAVRRGLSWASVVWAFTVFHAANWHPITWLSHMLDCQLFGLNAGWHHFTNLLFHTANSVLLFLLLKSVTNGFWKSAIVAGLFAWHPLHVESVAWISERKDVLSAFFFMLTLWAYTRYAKESRSVSLKSKVAYAGALAFFALGLMSKPMLVTLPALLLLLDFWPLRRFRPAPSHPQRASFPRLLREKLPFFALSAGVACVTFAAQKSGGLVKSDLVSLMPRLENACVSYVRYLFKTVWPGSLAAYYPHPDAWSAWAWGGALAGLGLITLLVRWQAHRRSYLFFGWLWYGITLLPVIGLVRVGTQAMADRYMYIPSIGLFIAAVWGLGDLTGRWNAPRFALSSAAGLALGALGCVTRTQLHYWKDGNTLFQHCLAVTGESALPHWNLGCFFAEQRRWDEAVSHFAASLRLDPDNPNVYCLMGRALLATPRHAEAEEYLRESLSRYPTAEAHYWLGVSLARLGKLDEAATQYRLALQLQPDHALAHCSLANRLAAQANVDAAVAHYQAALRSEPDYPEAHNNLGNLLSQKSLFAQAAYHYTAALRAGSNYVDALNNLAWLRATCPDASVRDGPAAVTLAERALKLMREQNPEAAATAALDTLAAAYAETGRFDEAARAAEKAEASARLAGQQKLADETRLRLDLYRARQPCRDLR